METAPNAQFVLELVAANVRAARTRLGISQMELAERANLSTGYMNDVERARRWMSAKTLAPIAGALKMRPQQLFVEDKDSATDIHKILAEIVSELRESAGSNIERIVMRHAAAKGASTAKRGPRR